MKYIVLKIVSLFVFVIVVYFIILYFFRVPSLTENELGDYIGGVLNPLFALLSTVAIIFLSYVIAKAESNKADESIETQKRITMTQMRHESLNELKDNLNLFIKELDDLVIVDKGESLFVKKVMSRMKKEERENNNQTSRSQLWLLVLFEAESFNEKDYLFKDLFSDKDYEIIYNSLTESILALVKEHQTDEVISSENLGKFINRKQKFTTKIGDFILENF